jgi:putative FmdB family regulatory protein
MPTYEYKCPECGAKFDKVMRITDNTKVLCQSKDCGGEPERLISHTAFVLKGGGWYKSGYHQ